MANEQVIVIGAGASGMMAAARAAEAGVDVLLLEKMPRAGKKLLISGKERCNLTNTRELKDFIAMFGPNGRFLHNAFHRFFRDDLLAMLRRLGVETKSERGGRVFPASDDAADVVQALQTRFRSCGARMRIGTRASAIKVKDGKVVGVRSDQGDHPAAAVVLATGGSSFPATGSTGDGFKMAEMVGHSIVPLLPGLVPLIVKEENRAKSMQGVSLRNVRLTAYQGHTHLIAEMPKPTRDSGRGPGMQKPKKPVIASRMGEMMMTHFGIGGPIVLQMSLAVAGALKNGPVSVAIDMKPALSMEQLDRRMQRDIAANGKRGFHWIVGGLLPRKMVNPFVEMSGVPADKPCSQINANERKRFLGLLKCFCFNIKSPLPLTSAMVTAGGVSLAEIDPRTMESRKVKGLFLCGEVMDLDADTGGYNLQAAFSTGVIAGESAAAFAATG